MDNYTDRTLKYRWDCPRNLRTRVPSTRKHTLLTHTLTLLTHSLSSLKVKSLVQHPADPKTGNQIQTRAGGLSDGRSHHCTVSAFALNQTFTIPFPPFCPSPCWCYPLWSIPPSPQSKVVPTSTRMSSRTHKQPHKSDPNSYLLYYSNRRLNNPKHNSPTRLNTTPLTLHVPYIIQASHNLYPHNQH